MASPHIGRMFNEIVFSVSTEKLKEAMNKKAQVLQKKVEEREERILKLRSEFGITDEDIINVLAKNRREMFDGLSNSISVRRSSGEEVLLGAGLIQNLLTETDLIAQEKEAVNTLNCMTRNMGPRKAWGANGEEYFIDAVNVSLEELQYLDL